MTSWHLEVLSGRGSRLGAGRYRICIRDVSNLSFDTYESLFFAFRGIGLPVNPNLANSWVKAFLPLFSHRFLEKDALNRRAPSLVIDRKRGPERPKPTNW